MNSVAVSESTTAKREERWFLLRMVLLFALAIGAFLLLTMMRGPGGNSQFPRVQLSDGTWLVARAVTAGKNHSIEIPYPLDVQLSRWQRSYARSQTTQSDRMMVWLTHENSRGEALDVEWFAKCRLVFPDETRAMPNQYQRQITERHSSSGSGVGSTGYSDTKPFGTSGKVHMATISCDFPLQRPRETPLQLEVFDGSGKKIALLEIPYPQLPNPIEEAWQPEPLPATRTVGNLTVTLESMKYHAHPDQVGISAYPQLKFVHDGQPSNTWTASTELTDPLGNVAGVWNCDLSRLETAWKLRMTLHQTSSGKFLPEETRKLPLRPLADDKKLELTTETHTVNGVPVSLVGVGGKGPFSFTIPNSNSSFKTGSFTPGQVNAGISTSCTGNTCSVELSSGHPFLITGDNNSGVPGDIQFVIRDQDGEKLSQGGSSGTSGLMFWFFEPKPATTSIEVEIIVQKPRTVEFMIAPPKPDEIKSRDEM